MGPRWAYWIKDRSPTQVATSPPPRLRAAWPKNPSDPQGCWMVQSHPQGGTLCIFPRLDGSACNLEAFAAPRDTSDGMVFYPSREAPTTEFLIKPESMRGQGEWVTTYSGESLWVGLSFATPRRLLLSLSGMTVKNPVSEFGKLGHELYDDYFSKDGIAFSDQRLGRLLFLSLRESYTITEEMAEDLEFLTDRDIKPIVEIALGVSPKPSPAEADPSASAGQTTKTSP